MTSERRWSRPLRMVPWMPWARYQCRLDRPLWRRFLFGPCWCITHRPADCRSTWRRVAPERPIFVTDRDSAPSRNDGRESADMPHSGRTRPSD